jgi:hypothetical protein
LPGHVTTPITAGHPAVYKARPDFTPPAALDPAATPVELTNWRVEMDMHFVELAILDSVEASKQAVLKVAFHSKPIHFLTPQELVDEMLRKHVALTGPNLQKLRASLHEP